MRKLLFGLAVTAATLGFSQVTEAAFVLGNQAYVSNATTSASNAIGDSVFTLDFATLAGGTNQTGDFTGTSGSFINSLDVNDLTNFVFGGAGYGTFAVTAVNTNNLIPGVSRTINLTGVFTPDAAEFGPGASPTNGVLTITINQATKGTLSASATLATIVPEPSSMVLLGTFCAPAALGFIRRRRSMKLAK